jgi:hypothetical protein
VGRLKKAADVEKTVEMTESGIECAERYTKPAVWKPWRMDLAAERRSAGVPLRKSEKSTSYNTLSACVAVVKGGTANWNDEIVAIDGACLGSHFGVTKP